jgi:hypothetical protein
MAGEEVNINSLFSLVRKSHLAQCVSTAKMMKSGESWAEIYCSVHHTHFPASIALKMEIRALHEKVDQAITSKYFS